MRMNSVGGIAAALILSVILAGCASIGIQTDVQKAHARASAYIASHPTLDPDTASSIRELTLRRGMTMEEVTAAWGEPAVVQSYQGGQLQFWYFGCDTLHSCASVNRSSSPDQQYISKATFVRGKVTDWVE